MYRLRPTTHLTRSLTPVILYDAAGKRFGELRAVGKKRVRVLDS